MTTRYINYLITCCIKPRKLWCCWEIWTPLSSNLNDFFWAGNYEHLKLKLKFWSKMQFPLLILGSETDLWAKLYPRPTFCGSLSILLLPPPNLPKTLKATWAILSCGLRRVFQSAWKHNIWCKNVKTLMAFNKVLFKSGFHYPKSTSTSIRKSLSSWKLALMLTCTRTRVKFLFFSCLWLWSRPPYGRRGGKIDSIDFSCPSAWTVNLLGKVLPSLVGCGHTGSQVEDCQHTAPVSVSPGYHTMLKRKSQSFCSPAELNIVSLRAEGEGFHPANINITPGHFHRKQKENRPQNFQAVWFIA